MIKVNDSNSTKIAAMLAVVNGRAAGHTYTTAREISDLATNAERRLESLGIPKSMRTGAEIFAVSGDRVPNAYKYSRRATSARLVRRSTSWFIVSASTTTIWKEGGKVDLLLTEEQDAKAVSVLRAGYRVQRPATAIAA